ncbi:MAG: MBL fold metallo-hydrolase [Phycisphaerae bacterium]
MAVSFDIVSIGCLSRNRFWNEAQAVRPAHATTVLIRDAGKTILVDPSLPGELLARRLDERAGIKPEQIDCVFLTCFRPVHRRGLGLLSEADWLMGSGEIEAVRAHLEGLVRSAEQAGQAPDSLVRDELSLLRRIKPAPEKLTRYVHLFPSPGPTPGSCSLLLVPATTTVVVAGDVIVTRDYYEHGRAFELMELADQIIPGHDNLFVPLPKY